MYALFEETEMGDTERTREVWKACLEIIPHKKLTFAKIWIYFAHFEIRQKNLPEARKILGAGIGRAPKDKLFREAVFKVIFYLFVIHPCMWTALGLTDSDSLRL